MSENFDKNGANFVSPGSFNPHHENGNIGGGPTFGPQTDKMVRFQDPNGEPSPVDPDAAAIANRELINSRESMSNEIVAFAEEPFELFESMREILNRIEDGKVPSGLENHYEMTSLFGRMRERADNLRKDPRELLKQGKLSSYDEKTGRGTPRRAKYNSLALYYDQIPKENGYGVDIIYNYGTPEQRSEVAKAYDKAILEIESRHIMGEQLGLRLNPETRDGLENLAVYLRSGRTPKFKHEHLEAIFNMPSVTELNPQNGEKTIKVENARELGDQIEESMFLYLVMLNSGTKQKMLDLLDRPGAKYLISKMAKEQEARTGIPCTYDKWVKENIGDVNNWVDDNKRELDTFESSSEKRYRGKLTKWSNIAAFYPDNFNGDDEKDFIEKTIGGLVGSVEASWIATTMMRITGTYSSKGYVALPNGKSVMQLGEDGDISSDDFGKPLAYVQVLKEGLKNRDSFLKDLIGKVPDMAINLFDWAQVKVTLPDGSETKRSIWDAWLGTAKDKQILDVLTQEPTGKLTKEEPYHRLGDLNFKSLRRGFHGKFATIQWLVGSGKEPTGVLNEAFTSEFRVEDFRLKKLKKINKYVGIVFNPLTMTGGSMHLYDTSKLDVVKRNFMRNMMLARLNSQSFALDILPAKMKLFNPDLGKDVEVPAPLFINACINEVLKPNPRTEEELIAHYLDENSKLRALGVSAGTANPGTPDDIVRVMKDKYLPVHKVNGAYVVNDDEVKLMEYVGPVTGKNKF